MLILSVANSAFLHFWHVRLIARPRKNSLIVRDPALGPWEPHLPLKTIFLHAEGDLKDNPHTFSRGQICKMIGELKNKQDYFQWKNLRSRFRSSWQTFGRHKSIRKTLPTKKIKFKKTAVEKLVQSLDFLFCFKALIAFWQKCCETEIFCVFQNHGKSLSWMVCHCFRRFARPGRRTLELLNVIHCPSSGDALDLSAICSNWCNYSVTKGVTGLKQLLVLLRN